MSFNKSSTPSTLLSNTLYVIGFIGLISCLPTVSAFGSGNIPAAAYLKGKAWRHGDIEDTLEGLVKVAGHSGGAIVGAIASALLGSASGSIGRKGGKKFSGLDVKRIYFGNWLRDLSQVCDIAGFKAMTPESLVTCIMTMGFLSFGYATREFQVTRERLSVYLLTEHIDNPKGYAEGEDPRKYDPRLRPPVDEARELRIDERNGMKMYIASDDQGFDTSTACIRRVFRKCIQLGREAQREGNQEKEFESFRLLGTGLHTLEDFSAHSNWCELALQKLGHKDVFAHVGENVRVNSPEGSVPPLVTGTFAGADFCFSMLGEASDKLSSSSIADLTAQLDTAQSANNKPGGINLDFIKSIMSKLPLGGKDSEVQHDLDSMDQKKNAFDLDGRIDQIAPEELQAKIWELFKVRDNLMRRVEEIIEGIPGLSDMLENLSLSLAQWVMVTIDPFVRPVLLEASSAIGKQSQAVISGNDQWTVFNDPNASDPTHSVLAKDHFSNILNDPAGNISVIIVKYTVGLMVGAWSNDENPDRVIDRILESIHHPNYANRNSEIQGEMLEYMQKWLNEMDRDERALTIKSLTKDSIRNHRNQRKTSKTGVDPRLEGGAPSHGHSHPAYQQNSMHGGSYSQSQHQNVTQSSSAGYSSSQSVGVHSQNKYGDSHTQSQHGGYQSQGRLTGSQSGTHNQYDNNRKTGNQGGYAHVDHHSSQTGRVNQPNLQGEYRNDSGGFGSSRPNVNQEHSASYGRQPEPTVHSQAFGSSPGRDSSRHNLNTEHSASYGRQPEPIVHSQAFGSSPGRDNYSRDTSRETGAYKSVAEARDQYSAASGPEQNFHPQPYGSSAGRDNIPTSGYGHQTQGKDPYASHSSHTTSSTVRRDDYEQISSRNDYNQSNTSFPQAHVKPVESSYDRPGSEHSSRHNATHGDYQSGRPAFPEADYGTSQPSYGRGNQSAADAYPNRSDSGRQDYDSNPRFPQAQHSSGGTSYPNDGRRGNETTYGHHQADTGSTYNTAYPEKYGNTGRDAGYGQQPAKKDSNRHHRGSSKHSEDSDDSRGSKGSKKKNKHDKYKKSKSPGSPSGSHSTYQNQGNRTAERNYQADSDYGMNRLNMQDDYSRRY